MVKVVVSGGCLDHNSDLDTLREKGGNELTIVLLNSAGKVKPWIPPTCQLLKLILIG